MSEDKFASYKGWENGQNLTLVKSKKYIFHITDCTGMVLLLYFTSVYSRILYFTSDYSRIGSSQFLQAWQLQDPDVQPLELISLAVATGYQFPFSVFLGWFDVIVLCITSTLYMFMVYSCNDKELSHYGMLLMWERNKLDTETLILMSILLYLDLDGFSLDLYGLNRVKFKMHGNPTPAM